MHDVVAKARMTLQTGGDLTPALESLWKEGELSDVILVSKDAETFKAHKIILAAAIRLLPRFIHWRWQTSPRESRLSFSDR